MQTLIHNATLVLPDGLLNDGWLLIEDERIAALGGWATCPDPASTGHAIDATGGFLLPGVIDLHCDAIEKLVEPRPNVFFDLALALAEADWRLAGSGITTEFHAISLDDNEFGVRSDGFLADLAQAIRSVEIPSSGQGPTLLVRHNIHARLELSSLRGFTVISDLIAAREVRLVSLMDHSPGQGQYTTEQAYRDYIRRTTHKNDAEVDEVLALKRSQAAAIPGRIAQVTRLAREAGIAIATHDDDSVEKVEQWPALGITFSEFPTTLEAAQRAQELGLHVCMGAPNALRGRSSGGNVSAVEAIAAGIVDVLCSDYYPAAMLAAVFRLAAQHILSLPEAIQLVTLNAAKAVGMDSTFGSLEAGKIADLVLMRLNTRRLPVVRRVFVG